MNDIRCEILTAGAMMLMAFAFIYGLLFHVPNLIHDYHTQALVRQYDCSEAKK